MAGCYLVDINTQDEPPVTTPEAVKMATHVADCLFAPEDPRHARAVEIVAINLDAFHAERLAGGFRAERPAEFTPPAEGMPSAASLRVAIKYLGQPPEDYDEDVVSLAGLLDATREEGRTAALVKVLATAAAAEDARDFVRGLLKGEA